MNHVSLGDLYRATEEDLLYGIGRLALPGQDLAPFIQIHYRDWSREKLEIVRESFRAGLNLVVGSAPDGACHVHVSTQERVAVHVEQGEHTSVLRAPAWDAHLTGIDEQVVHWFEIDRRRFGGFLLLMQTPEGEFRASTSNAGGRVRAAAVQPRSFPVPADQATS